MSAAAPIRRIDVPAGTGRSWTMKAGEVVRIVAPEGPQAADLIAFNRADQRESLSAWLTRHISGSFTKADGIYSKLPAGRLMFTVLSDPTDRLWLSPGHCNALSNGEGEPNCHDILAECVSALSLTSFDVPEVLNIFMNVEMRPDGTYAFRPSPVRPGDYFEMRAEMDLWVAVSACPDKHRRYCLGEPKALAVEIWR